MRMHDKEIIKCMHNLGIIVDDENDNFMLENYIEDSIAYISFIVELEQTFNIEIPDEYLVAGAMTTLADVCNMISESQLERR